MTVLFFVSLTGDLDLVSGEYFGKLIYVENTGTSTAPLFVKGPDALSIFDYIDVGWYSAPAFADLDGDGMLRLCPLIGSDRKSHVSAAHRRPGPRRGRAQWLA